MGNELTTGGFMIKSTQQQIMYELECKSPQTYKELGDRLGLREAEISAALFPPRSANKVNIKEAYVLVKTKILKVYKND